MKSLFAMINVRPEFVFPFKEISEKRQTGIPVSNLKIGSDRLENE